MANRYVLDACALLAFFYKESGFDVVKSALEDADSRKANVYMNKLNLFEVYYDIMRSKGLEQAEECYEVALKLPINVIDGISDLVFREAGRIKTNYKMSIADSIALGEASILDAAILTSDHREFDIVERKEKIKFMWIR